MGSVLPARPVCRPSWQEAAWPWGRRPRPLPFLKDAQEGAASPARGPPTGRGPCALHLPGAGSSGPRVGAPLRGAWLRVTVTAA